MATAQMPPPEAPGKTEKSSLQAQMPPPEAPGKTEKSSLHSEAETPAESSGSVVTLSTGEGAGSKKRDVALAKVSQERTHSQIRAWEDNEKSKSLNKYDKVITETNAWENTKKATAEANLRKAEEALEKQRAAYIEKMKNEIAEVHRTAEEKRAIAEAKKGEEFVKAEELAAKYRASGKAPKKSLCFGG